MTKQSYILIGHPVGHSMSPAIHGAVYRRFDLPHTYTAVDCPTEQSVAEQVNKIRHGELAGANVTVPWKKVALGLADRADPTAAKTGAANVLARGDSGEVVAYNTDVSALAACLRAGATQAGAAVVFGNGGAALAGVSASQLAGAAPVWVTARAFSEDLPRAEWPHREQFEALGATLVAWDRTERSELQQTLAAASLIVQATSAGMLGKGGGEALADMVPWQRLRSDVFLYDLVYNPPVTAFLERAGILGLKAEGGLSMLVGQAARAVEIWLGVTAPRAEMTAAAERILHGLSE